MTVGKRLVDLAAAVVALLVLSPLLLLAAIAVGLSSPGPILFRQERVGRGGALFRMNKFRTMRADAEAGPALTVGNDPRITRIGALLRASKIDELPQLLNVIAGDMSVVGPRPEVTKYVALWPPALREEILSVRPGMTDPASIKFRNESDVLAQYPDPERAYREIIMPEKLQLYAAYVRTHTLIGDLRLLGQTVAAVLHG